MFSQRSGLITAIAIIACAIFSGNAIVFYLALGAVVVSCGWDCFVFFGE